MALQNEHLSNTPLNFNQIVEIIKQLPPLEKNKLIEILEADQEIISENHKNIVRQRIKKSDSDPSLLLPWDEVKHKINL